MNCKPVEVQRVMKEPQIGIEPMTARQGKGHHTGAPLWSESTTIGNAGQEAPEADPKSDESGNEVATEDEGFTRLSNGRTRHEAIIDAMESEGWKRVGLRPFLKARAKAEIAEALASYAADDHDGPLDADDLRGYSEWGHVLAALGGRIPDAWRIVEEDSRHGWGYPVTVLELAEVCVTHFLSAAKWEQYAYLWMTGDSMDYIAVRIYGVDAMGAMSPLVADMGGYFYALRRSGCLDRQVAA